MSEEEQLNSELMSRLGPINAQGGQTDHVSYLVWGAAATTTRAFDKVSLRIDPNTNRIFVAIKLRWWARFEKFKRLHDAWLRIAEKRCKEAVPTGWKLLIYYDRGTDGT